MEISHAYHICMDNDSSLGRTSWVVIIL